MNELGENIKLARLRRKLSAELVSERADIGRTMYLRQKSQYSMVNSIHFYLNVLIVPKR